MIMQSSSLVLSVSNQKLQIYIHQNYLGNAKRAALARAIAAKPSLIFFDEPTAGLDPIMSTVISTLISDLSKKLKATTITITHDMKCVGIVADQVAMIYEGTVIWQGDKSDLYNTKTVSSIISYMAICLSLKIVNDHENSRALCNKIFSHFFFSNIFYHLRLDMVDSIYEDFRPNCK